MIEPTKINLKVYQGRSLVREIPLISTVKVFKPVNTISKSAPTKVAVLKHGLPGLWQVKISDVRGMKEINSQEYCTTKVISPDVFELVGVNSNGFSEYTGSGTIEYFQPMLLDGFTPRLQLRSGTEVILETTPLLNLVNNSLEIVISAAQTTTLTRTQYGLRIDLVKDSLVLAAVIGNVTVMKE